MAGSFSVCACVPKTADMCHTQFHRTRGVDYPSALLPLPWTVIHAMDEHSPLYGTTPQSLAETDAEIIALLDGTDEVKKQNKTKQNKTKQNKTKQNKTKQNKKHERDFTFTNNLLQYDFSNIFCVCFTNKRILFTGLIRSDTSSMVLHLQRYEDAHSFPLASCLVCYFDMSD